MATTHDYLANIKAMIEENHDPRNRDDGTKWRGNGVLAEVYAAVCQAVDAPVEPSSHPSLTDRLLAIQKELESLHGGYVTIDIAIHSSHAYDRVNWPVTSSKDGKAISWRADRLAKNIRIVAYNRWHEGDEVYETAPYEWFMMHYDDYRWVRSGSGD